MTARLAALSLLSALAASPQSADSVRKEIETAYAKALDALRNAKSMEELDELDRSFDTQDWQTISPGQSPRGWQDLRKYGFEGLWAPFKSSELIIDTFELHGDIAVLTGHLRQVWMKDNVSLMGWKRQIHQKFPPGQVPK